MKSLLFHKFRIFQGRLIAVIISSFVIGVETMAILEQTYKEEESIGYLIVLAFMLFIYVFQIISQYLENKYHTTEEEFRAASFVKVWYLHKTIFIPIKRFIIMTIALFILGTQGSLLMYNLDSEIWISGAVGMMAMLSILVYQISLQWNETKNIPEL
jgi:hypothetical protein